MLEFLRKLRGRFAGMWPKWPGVQRIAALAVIAVFALVSVSPPPGTAPVIGAPIANEEEREGAGFNPEDLADIEPNVAPAYRDRSNPTGAVRRTHNKVFNEEKNSEERSPAIDRVIVPPGTAPVIGAPIVNEEEREGAGFNPEDFDDSDLPYWAEPYYRENIILDITGGLYA